MTFAKYLLNKLLIIFLSINVVSGFSQNIKKDELKLLIDNNKYLSKIHTGISIFDLENSQEILNYNSNKKFIPASVLKLFYTLAAVETKGEEYKFVTKFYRNGKVLSDGTLEGDILIYPSGDPTLGSPRFYNEGLITILKRIETELLKNDINCIEGDIIMVLPNQSFPIHGSWPIEDLGNYYGGGAWPFNFNDNEYKLTFQTNINETEPTKINSIIPNIPEMDIVNHVSIGPKGSGDQAYIYGTPYNLKREVRGTLPKGNNYTIRGSIPSPPSSFMKILGNYLNKNNIYYKNIKIYEEYSKNKTLVFEIESPNLLAIAKECNNYSINMYCEALAQLLCLTSSHRNDYLYDDEINLFFRKYNIDIDQINISDGCGLSPDNILSPYIINNFIANIINKIGIDRVLNIIPEAGKDGYAKRIKVEEKKIWVKSGSINGVLNYSGIIKKKNGKYFIFSIMTNNFLPKEQKLIKKEIFNLLKTII